MSTELMLLDKSSLPAYLELRKEVQENFVGPVARIMQIELDLLKSGFSEPALMMENFNEILDLYPEAMLYSEEEQKIIRRVLHSAVVQFVAFAQMNLIVERRKVRDSLKSFILSTFDGAVPIIKEAILGYFAGAASGKCSKMLTALEKLSKNEEFKLNCESFVDVFFRNTLDFASLVLGHDEKTSDACRLVEKMLQKMKRHSRLIGPSIKISEMIRDYSEWLYEKEVEAVNSKYNKFSTKIYNMMFGRMGCSICALLSLIAIVWMCFSDSLLPKLMLIIALLYPVAKRLAPKIQRSIELWMCKNRLNKRMKIAEKFDV